jgi:hypothetical protein
MMSDRAVARLRTALPQGWAAVIVILLDACNVSLISDRADTLVIATIPLVGAGLYEIGRTLEGHGYRRLALVLLGTDRTPSYD